MSHVTNVILTVSLMDETNDDIYPAVESINTWLGANSYGSLEPVNDHAGGRKHMEVGVFAAAFNHLSISDFIDVVKKAPWVEPEDVCLFIQDQHEETFKNVLMSDELQKRIIQLEKERDTLQVRVDEMAAEVERLSGSTSTDEMTLSQKVAWQAYQFIGAQFMDDSRPIVETAMDYFSQLSTGEIEYSEDMTLTLVVGR